MSKLHPGAPHFRRALLTFLIITINIISAAAEEPPRLPVFTDVTTSAGIHAKHGFGDFDLSNIVEGTGAGAMFFDYDADGLLDIYLPNGCYRKDINDNRGRSLKGKLTNSLYRNLGGGRFADLTEKSGTGDSGFGFGCSAADYDRDGDLDIYVLNYGPNVLYRNDGHGVFTDVSKESRLDDPSWSLSATWLDYDNDGDLDVYIANYLQYDDGLFRSYYAAQNYPGPLSYGGQPDSLRRNNGDGTFTDVTQAAGLYKPDGRAMSATAADLNNDGFLDLYVSNDAMGNYYYRNTSKGGFEDEGLVLGLSFGEGGQGVSSMGPTAGDINGDGRIDIYIPDMGYGCLLINLEDYFEDRTATSKLAVVSGQYTGWGAVLLDYDNDGRLDIFIANGDAHHEHTEEDVLMRNAGAGLFQDVAKTSGEYFMNKYVGRGAAYGDYDNDGDIDLLISNLNDTPRLLRNDGGNRNNWLTVEVIEAGPGSIPAIGARVAIKTTGGTAQIRDISPTTGYLSQSDPRAHFGLGQIETVDAVEVSAPGRRPATLQNVSANQILKVILTPETQE